MKTYCYRLMNPYGTLQEGIFTAPDHHHAKRIAQKICRDDVLAAEEHWNWTRWEERKGIHDCSVLDANTGRVVFQFVISEVREPIPESSASDAPPPRQCPLPSQADTGAEADNRGPAIKVSDRLLEITDKLAEIEERLSEIWDDYARECASAEGDGEPEPALTELERYQLNRIPNGFGYELMVDEIQDVLSGEPEPPEPPALAEWGRYQLNSIADEYESMVDEIQDVLSGEYESTELERYQLNSIADECESMVDEIQDVLSGE